MGKLTLEVNPVAGLPYFIDKVYNQAILHPVPDYHPPDDFERLVLQLKDSGAQ